MSINIGIDLGTTFSCVAVVEGGKPKVIETMKVKPPHPMCFVDGEIKKEVAKRGAVNHPEDTVFAFKRLVGHKNSDEVVQNLNVPYQLKPAKMATPSCSYC